MRLRSDAPHFSLPPSRARSLKTRVTIVGGGLSGLCAAYELSRTPELRDRYEVTVYQMGWRLGGKLASGRNRACSMRNEEHGLHVWFGFYDNAFRLAREVHERWRRPSGCPFSTVWDVFTPHVYTPIGAQCGDDYDVWNVRFARNGAVPGDDPSEGTSWEWLGRVVGALETSLANFCGGALGRVPSEDARRGRPRFSRAPGAPHPRIAAPVELVLSKCARALHGALASIRGRPGHPAVRRVRAVLVKIHALVPVLDRMARRRPELRNARCAVEFFTAFLLGLTNPAYGVLLDFDLDRLNHLEFREWLHVNGASRALLDEWSFVRVPYDATFNYIDGDLARPSFEAGTAARFLLRAYFGYRGAAAFLVEAGMGEAFIAPLYEVLCEQGVRFQFFHRLERLEIDRESNRAARLVFRRQARTKGPYRPLFTHRGLRCWPSEPDWSQLEDGDGLRDAGVRFEHDPDVGRRRVLHDEIDYDEVIIALPIGALRSLDDRPSCVEAMLDHRPALRRLVEGINVVPSIAAQLWCTPDTAGLGWPHPRPAMVSWALPLCIWADMSPVIAVEGWSATTPPGSTHYLCGTWHTDLHRQPPSRERTEAADRAAQAALVQQLARHGTRLWPRAADRDGGFDWNVLHDPRGRSGPDRVAAQYVRANVEPSDLCDVAKTGTAPLRPQAHESGLHNVVLAGTWTRTNVNSTCVEAATMSGLAAARVLTGPVRTIHSEFFLQRRRPVVWREPVNANGERQWTVA